MSIERALFAFGGVMVMITSLLALFHHPNWTWVTLFIGFNCLQSAFTGFCPPRYLMKKFGLKPRRRLHREINKRSIRILPGSIFENLSITRYVL